jgi:hypothetical protein
MAQVGTCVACEVTNVRVATATAECACHVCEHCAELFMADGACGVCGAALSTDDLEEEDDASASRRVGPMVGDMDKRRCCGSSPLCTRVAPASSTGVVLTFCKPRHCVYLWGGRQPRCPTARRGARHGARVPLAPAPMGQGPPGAYTSSNR